jgi:small redox-active disulfide protein 2
MEGVTMIRIGGVEIGMLDLEETFERVKQLEIQDVGEQKSRILQEVKMSNYVPSSKESEYTEGLFKAYRRYLGEKVEEEIEGLEIKILGPGCARCDKLERDVRSLLTEMNVPAEIQHVRDPMAIADYGVMGTPALVMNRVIKAAGRVPRKDEIMKWIQELQRV